MNRKQERISHTGVLEFIADEGKVYLPGWMMRNLLLGEGIFEKLIWGLRTDSLASVLGYRPRIDLKYFQMKKAI